MSQPKSSPPPQAQMLQMITGKWVSAAIAAAARFDIAGHLASGPQSIQELAALTGTHAPSLYRLLRATASLGIFRQLDDGRFEQTPLSETLRGDANSSVRNMALMNWDDWHVKYWAELPWSVETGRPAAYKVHGMGNFEWFTQHPDEAVNFNNAMTDMSQLEGPPVAASYDYSTLGHIVDIAGGFGTLLAAILQKTPGLRGTLFEMPYFIDQVRDSPILAPYKDRCDMVAGDFFASVPSAGAYIMKHIIHDWDDEKAGVILSNCRASIQPEGKLLVVDQVVPPGNEPGWAKILDLEMLVAPGGKERTETEFRELFAASGFRLDRVIPTPTGMCILEGSPV